MNRVIIKSPSAFRDALQQDDRLFDEVVRLIEAKANGDLHDCHRIASQQSVICTRAAAGELYSGQPRRLFS